MKTKILTTALSLTLALAFLFSSNFASGTSRNHNLQCDYDSVQQLQ